MVCRFLSAQCSIDKSAVLRFFRSAAVVAVFFLCAVQPSRAQVLALSTNVVPYAEGGTLNVEASVGVSRHWSVGADALYNPYSEQSRQRSFSVGARYWPWHIYSGWWLSGSARYQEFSRSRSEDYSTAGNPNLRTVEGDRFGSGIAGGYSRVLSKHLNVDVGFGLWAGYETYTAYECAKCGRYIDDGSRVFLLPDRLTLAITYVF